MQTSFFIGAVFLVASFHFALSHVSENVVMMEKRSSIGMHQTEWAPVVEQYCPRWMQDRKIQLPARSWEQEVGDFKMSFAFDHQRKKTSWITITSRKKSLNYIEFTFVVHDNILREVKVITDYSNEAEHQDQAVRIPENVFLHYKWEEKAVYHPNRFWGIIFLCSAVGFLVQMVFLWSSSFTNERRTIEKSGDE